MTIEECLGFADEWNAQEGSEAWRVVCSALAEEVRRRHGIGGELMAARRERDELAAEMRGVFGGTAKKRFDDCGGSEEPDPIERLRFFCSLAMKGQDWIDVEPFFEALMTHNVK